MLTPEVRVAQRVTDGPVALVEAVVCYHRVGDGPGVDWAEAVLRHAESEEDIEPGWAVVGEWSRVWVQTIVFTFRVHMPCDEDGAVPAVEALDWAHQMASVIVGESDVQVLGVKVVEPDLRPTPETCPVGTRVRNGDEFGTIIDWQSGGGVIRIQYDDGTRSIGAVNPNLRRVE